MLQFQADLLEIPVLRSRLAETTALGAAYFAGLAVSFWLSKSELAEHWQADKRFEPQIPMSEITDCVQRWHDAVRRTLHIKS